MQYVIPCPNIDAIIALNESTEPLYNSINEALSFDSIYEDAYALNKLEELIPDDIRFQLELNIILEKGKSTAYHKGLLEGRNILVEESLDYLSSDTIQKINEQLGGNLPYSSNIPAQEYGADNFNNFIRNLGNKMNPEGSSEGDNVPTNIDQTKSAEIDSALDKADIGDKDAGFLGLLKKFALAITEGGSPIGILHLTLDIIGVVGDIWYPVGLIADILNGLIYLIRGKYLLALMSFIAAVIPFAGPVFKNVFKASKAGKEVTTIISRYFAKGGAVEATSVASTKISKDVVHLAASASPKSIDALQYISKVSRGALGTVAEWISKFFKDFLGKITGLIPFIGKPLKKMFDKIGNLFKSFRTRAAKMADKMPLVIEKAHLKKMDDFFKFAAEDGTQMITKGNSLIVTKGGKQLAELPGSLLKSTDFLKNRYGGIMSSEIEAYIKSTNKNVIKFYDEIIRAIKANNKLYGKVNRFGTKAIIAKQSMAIFIGKQIIKYLNDMGLIKKDLNDSEAELIGNISMRETMQTVRDNNLKKDPNAVYDVPYIDQFEEPEAYNTMHKSLNKYARMMNLPQIGMLTYSLARGSGAQIPEDVGRLWTEAYPNIKPLDPEDLVLGKDKETNENKSYKYILPFDKF